VRSQLSVAYLVFVACIPIHRFSSSARLSGQVFLCFSSLSKPVFRVNECGSLNFRVRARGCRRFGLLATVGGPPGSLPLSSQPSLLHRPSFFLHLYDHFVRDNETSDPSSHYPENHNNLMEIDVDAADATPGVPPSADDAIVLPVSSLSSSSGITTPRFLTSVKGKNSTKRELADDSHSAILAKKSASTDFSSSNTSISRDPGRGDTSSSTSLPIDSTARTYRYNNKNQSPFVVQVYVGLGFLTSTTH